MCVFPTPSNTYIGLFGCPSLGCFTFFTSKSRPNWGNLDKVQLVVGTILASTFLKANCAHPYETAKGAVKHMEKNCRANYSPRFTNLILSQLVLKAGKYTSWVLVLDTVAVVISSKQLLVAEKAPSLMQHLFKPSLWVIHPYVDFSKAQSCCVLVFKPAFFLI